MGKFNKQNAAKDKVPNKLRVTFNAFNRGLAKLGGNSSLTIPVF